MEYAIFLLLGIGVGTFGTLVGIGGGLILFGFFGYYIFKKINRCPPDIVGIYYII